jgi:tetratricopeptide (TPR) repeat protein
MLVTAGEEITAHGAPALGRRFLEQAVDWLRTQRLVDSTLAAHRYWLGSALYNLGRWEEAAREFEGLAAAEPDRLDYRGLAALAASRLGRPDAASLLDDHQPRERGEVAMFRGRLAAARGDVAEAASRFREAVGLGVPGLPWLHASAVRDLAPLQAAGAELPRSLTVARP